MYPLCFKELKFRTNYELFYWHYSPTFRLGLFRLRMLSVPICRPAPLSRHYYLTQIILQSHRAVLIYGDFCSLLLPGWHTRLLSDNSFVFGPHDWSSRSFLTLETIQYSIISSLFLLILFSYRPYIFLNIFFLSSTHTVLMLMPAFRTILLLLIYK